VVDLAALADVLLHVQVLRAELAQGLALLEFFHLEIFILAEVAVHAEADHLALRLMQAAALAALHGIVLILVFLALPQRVVRLEQAALRQTLAGRRVFATLLAGQFLTFSGRHVLVFRLLARTLAGARRSLRSDRSSRSEGRLFLLVVLRKVELSLLLWVVEPSVLLVEPSVASLPQLLRFRQRLPFRRRSIDPLNVVLDSRLPVGFFHHVLAVLIPLSELDRIHAALALPGSLGLPLRFLDLGGGSLVG